MRRFTLLTVLGLSLLLALAAPVSAIQFAEPDGTDHPQVGLMVAQVEVEGNLVPAWRCSGTLLSETIFLTAGHCVFGSDRIVVWFDAGPVPLGSGYPSATPGDPCDGVTGYPCTGDSFGTGTAHPEYDDFAAFPATFDIGIVVLDTPQTGVPYATLADIGTLDALATSKRKGAHFDLVGYGLQDSLPPTIVAQRTRYAGEAKLINTRSTNNVHSVQLTAAPGTGGALCFGDSGGPVFLKDTLEIVAVNSFVFNLQCMGSGFSYRTDTQDSYDFVDGFLNP